MQTPVDLALYGDRNVLFNTTLGFYDLDLTGATFRMQIRVSPDQGGSPLVSLTTGAGGIVLVYAGTDTVANHIASNRITEKQVQTAGYADTDTLTLSLVNVQISQAAMAFASTPAAEVGDDVLLSYDFLVTPAAGTEDKYLYGPFIVRGTVTV